MVKELSQEEEAAFYLRSGKKYWDPYHKEFNLEEGFRLFEKSAEDGNAEAMFILANSYLYGRGTEPNEASAYVWLDIPADSRPPIPVILGHLC